MTAATAVAETRTRSLRGHYGFADLARMEWIKLRSVRSTSWGLAIFTVSLIGSALLFNGLTSAAWGHMPAADRASWDPTNLSFTGLIIGQLVTAVLGVLFITSEYSSGLIRSTFAAAPRRPLVLAAKTAVFGGLALLVGEVLAFASFFAGELIMRSDVPHASLATPTVLRAVLMAGAYAALTGLFGLGLGALIRRTAGGLAAAAGVIFVLPFLTLPLPDSIRNDVTKFLPEPIAASSISAVRPEAHALSPWLGFALLCLYAAVLLAAGTFALARRDV
ncbi:MAG: ABC transporter permease [Actinobacteria bacterium]|nr:ABC transporter permease [Actinomycetota bacterium]